MNYDRIGMALALCIAVFCSVSVVVGVVALWFVGTPLVVSIGVTVLVLAVAAMLFCFVMASRN